MYSCHHFLISSVSVYYCAHLCIKCSLGISSFLKRSLVLPILLFSFISLHCLFKRAFLSLLAILWNSASSWAYLSLSPLLFASLISSVMCTASSDDQFTFLKFWGEKIVLVTTSYTMLQISIHSSCGTLFIKSNPLNLFVNSTV